MLAWICSAGVSSPGPHDIILLDHDFKHLLGVLVGEFALIDLGSDACVEGVDAFVRLLAHI